MAVKTVAVKSEGPHVADFIESHCRLTRGLRTGELVKLVPFQRELLNQLFELREDGRRRYRRAYLQLPRKNGKTFLASCVSLYAALMDELGGEIYYVAGDRQQASRAFDEVKRIVEQDKELASLIKIFRLHMEIPSSGTILRVLSADAGLQMGLSPSFVVFDELAVQPNDRLWSAMNLGSGTRLQPLILAISTPGWEQESLAFRLYQHGKQVESGEIEDPTFFFRCWEPKNPEANYRDPAVWAEANPALSGVGGFLHEEDFASVIATTPENEFRRFRLGQWTTTQDVAFPDGAWEACVDRDRQVQPGTAVSLGFDGSTSKDCTALVGCTIDNPHVFVIGVWEPTSVDRVDVKDVVEAIRQSLKTYDVRALNVDETFWTWVMLELDADRAPVLSIPQNVPRKVQAWMRFSDAVFERRFTHDASPILRRHVANLVLKSDRFGVRVTRDRTAPRSFIDAAMAAIFAYDYVASTAPVAGLMGAWT